METRKLPRGNEEISVIGLGSGSLQGSVDEMTAVIRKAMERGINFFDVAPSREEPLYAYGKAFKGKRDQVYTQMHFGAVYKDGKYGWSRDLDEIKKQFRKFLEILDTDYTDFGYIHCVDDVDDLEDVLNNGIFDYMKELKEKGVIHHLGFSSHNPEIARRLIETGEFDLFMFSINPAYDYTTPDEYAFGSLNERNELYLLCKKLGVGISVMKPFQAGQLLDARTSLFKEAFRHEQCLQYCLDKPAVITTLPGVRDMADLERILYFDRALESEKDYSRLLELSPVDAVGVCTYCNHCQPCPVGLDVGLINKYYDLSKAGDPMAVSHYEKLNLHAGDCVYCGHCENRCPFSVKQPERMKEISLYFGY